jgi:hypothetical protein
MFINYILAKIDISNELNVSSVLNLSVDCSIIVYLFFGFHLIIVAVKF